MRVASVFLGALTGVEFMMCAGFKYNYTTPRVVWAVK